MSVVRAGQICVGAVGAVVVLLLSACADGSPIESDRSLTQTRHDAREVVSSTLAPLPVARRSERLTLDDRASPCKQSGDDIQQWIYRLMLEYENGTDTRSLALGLVEERKAAGWLVIDGGSDRETVNMLLRQRGGEGRAGPLLRVTATPTRPRLTPTVAVGASGPCVAVRRHEEPTP
ncbi:hypothetical protein GCM10022256_05350 [Frondihabitans peucedani]|uniref:Lipoprotein n=1 Tax=Frondihabitans peucedani TaxID=598626 RepID=A0ABP8DY49_9MICO